MELWRKYGSADVQGPGISLNKQPQMGLVQGTIATLERCLWDSDSVMNMVLCEFVNFSS